MKTHIKLYIFFLFVFASVNYSYAQSDNSSDNASQDNAVTEQQNTDNSTPGNSNAVPEKSDNQLLNAAIDNNNNPTPERVKGTRAPNEFSSGRTGGQYNFSQNPATVMPRGNPYNKKNSGYGSIENHRAPSKKQSTDNENAGEANQPQASTSEEAE